MKNMEQLQKNYEKEVRLVEQHKKNAADIKKQMESMREKNIKQKITALNMDAAEFDSFMKLLSSGKKTVLEAIHIVAANDDAEEVKISGNKEEEAPD